MIVTAAGFSQGTFLPPHASERERAWCLLRQSARLVFFIWNVHCMAMVQTSEYMLDLQIDLVPDTASGKAQVSAAI